MAQESIEAVSGTVSIQPQQQPTAQESIDTASDDDPRPTTQRSNVLDDWSMSNAIDSDHCPLTCSQTLSDASENVAALDNPPTHQATQATPDGKGDAVSSSLTVLKRRGLRTEDASPTFTPSFGLLRDTHTHTSRDHPLKK